MKQLYTRIFLLALFLCAQVGLLKAQDAGVSKLLSPVDQTCGSVATTIIAIVNNYGSTTISNIPVVVTCTGSASFTFKDTLKKTITSGNQDTIVFKSNFNNSGGGSFTFKVYTNISGDTKHSNDTLKQNFVSLLSPANPSVKDFISCGTGPVKFKGPSSTAGSRTFWYSSSTAASSFAVGDSITPTILKTTTLYAMSSFVSYDSLTTSWAGGNQQNGNMFDVRAKKNIMIDSFDVSPYGFVGTDTVFVYYKAGTYVGSQSTASAWKLLGKAPITSSSSTTYGQISRVRVGGLILPANALYGLYITLRSGTNYLAYTTLTAKDSIYNSTMTYYSGDGICALFGSSCTNCPCSPRRWNGGIHYTILGCNSQRVSITATVITPVKNLTFSKNASSKGAMNKGTSANPDEICLGDTLKFDISSPSNYNNADYGTKWKLSYNMRTYRGYSTTNYSIINPSSTAKGLFSFSPKTGNADSTYILTVSASNLVSGCDSVFTRYIHVNNAVTSSYTIGTACLGHQLTLSNKSSSGSPMKYIWRFKTGDSSTLALPTYTYTSVGSYNLSLIAYNGGCSSVSSKSITVYNTPVGSNWVKGTPFRGQMNTGDIFDPDNVCIGDTNTYQVSPPKGLSNSDYGTKWAIKSLTIATAGGLTTKDTLTKYPTVTKNLSFSFFPSKNVDSVFLVKMIISTLPGGCDTLMYRYIHIRVKPTPIFGSIPACFGSPVQFKDSSKITISSVASWAWDFGDGTTSTAQNPAHSYTAAGTYKVKLIAYSDAGCGASITHNAVQYPRTIVKFGVIPGCNTQTTTFKDSSSLSSGVIASWKWSFGDGATSSFASPTHVYAKSGPYTIKLLTTTGFGCKDSLIKKIRVLPMPVSAFTFLNACVGSTIYFSNNSSDSGTGTKYLWDFGDASTSAVPLPTHSYVNNGTYKVSLKVTSKNGCEDTVSQQLTPYAKPVLKLYSVAGCTNQASTLGDSGKPVSGSLYQWDFGDKSTVQNKLSTMQHVYKKAGVYSYSVLLTNPAGCVDSQRKSVTIIDFPKAVFTANDVCIGATTSFVNSSTGPGTLTYKWDFGDKSATVTTTSPTHKYTTTGFYTVKLKAINSNGCTDSFVKVVAINALPVAPPWIRNQVGYKVTFEPTDTTLASYKWYFGTPNNDSSSKKIPTFTYPTADKRYAVTLIVRNSAGCTASRVDSIGMGKYGIEGEENTFGGVKVYPNPFEGKTSITYRLETRAKVMMSVFDIQGKEIARIKDGMYEPGSYTDVFDASKYHAAEGAYFLRMYVNDKYFSTKMVNLK